MIWEKLAESCDCLNKAEQSDVDELIHLISMATCWVEQPCDTFLMGERKEVIDLDSCFDCCEIIKFAPFYTPFDETSFSFHLVKQKGIEEEIIPISEWNYSEVEGVFLIKPPLPNCNCLPQCECTCNPSYKLLVTYNAGYEELPDCLVPVFCEALQYVVERRTCDCTECQECTNYDEERTEILIPNAATITNQLKAYFVTTLSNQYLKQLGLISLCKNDGRLWGIVV